MDKYGEFNSKRFLIMLLLICSVFFIVIVKAFEYLPEEPTNTNNRQETVYSEENSTVEEQVPNEQETPSKNKTLNVSLPYRNEAPELDDVEDSTKESVNENLPTISDFSTSNEQNLSPEEQAAKIFLSVQKLKADKQYVKALEELQKIPSITNDKNTIARSYEEIAILYAIVKRYGTALSFAQKAYNMSPSTSRETLLARLYYKTGEIDKATSRINNVLQRDFSVDR